VILVVSPHLDDAVLGCGGLLSARPGAVVATLFAGAPRDGGRATPWDAQCGFAGAAEAVAARRAEDAAALALLGARPVHLDFCDSQYEETPTVEALAAALRAEVRRAAPVQVALPLGLYHSDHRLAHEAGRAALAGLAGLDVVFYEDALYRGLPGVLQRRLAGLAAAGLVATPARMGPGRGDADAKARALRCYASQLRAFGPGGVDDASEPERFWRLGPDEGAP